MAGLRGVVMTVAAARRVCRVSEGLHGPFAVLAEVGTN